MTTRRMRTIPEPRPYTRNILAPLNLRRAAPGAGPCVTYVCGECETPLVANVTTRDASLLAFVFRCNLCGAHNEACRDVAAPVRVPQARRPSPSSLLARLLG